jgi:hypothetical protein
MSSTAEIIRLANVNADIAGRAQPIGQDYHLAAVQAGVPADQIATAAEVAVHTELSTPAAPSAPGSLRFRADALRQKITYLEKQAPQGRSIAASREELARVLALDPAA